MMKRYTVLVSYLMLVGFVFLMSCDGAHERAGQKQDEAAANAAGVSYNGSGPAERMGEVQDCAEAAAREARETSAEALEAKGENIRRQAEVEATNMEQQARSIREAAEDRAKALKQEATAIKR